jgi:hypothetical protein
MLRIRSVGRLLSLVGAGGASGGAKQGAAGVLLKAAAQYLGVSRAELVKDARAGQTLAQIATAHGKSVDGLEAAMLAALKTKLDAAVSAVKLASAVASGRIKAAQA